MTLRRVASARFRELRGHRDMKVLLAALRAHAHQTQHAEIKAA